MNKKKPKSPTTPLPSPLSQQSALQDIQKIAGTPLPSPTSLADIPATSVAMIAATLTSTDLSPRDCVIKAYEILEWATFGQNTLRNSFSENFSHSGIVEWLSVQEETPSAERRDPTNALKTLSTMMGDAGAQKKHAERERCLGVLQRHLRWGKDDVPLQIDFEIALAQIIPKPGKDKSVRGSLFRDYLVENDGLPERHATKIIAEWQKDGLPWSEFEKALFNYTAWKESNISTKRSLSGKKGAKGRQGRVKKKDDKRLGARPPTGVFPG